MYLICDKKNKTSVGITDDLLIRSLNENSNIVYFEKFSDKVKAGKRKSQLSKFSNTKRISIIKKTNPEFLNLIFTIKDF